MDRPSEDLCTVSIVHDAPLLIGTGIIFLCSMLIAMAVPVAENGWLRLVAGSFLALTDSFWSGSFASEDYRHSPEFYVGWFAVVSVAIGCKADNSRSPSLATSWSS
jgi:hypothetical protein